MDHIWLLAIYHGKFSSQILADFDSLLNKYNDTFNKPGDLAIQQIQYQIKLIDELNPPPQAI